MSETPESTSSYDQTQYVYGAFTPQGVVTPEWQPDDHEVEQRNREVIGRYRASVRQGIVDGLANAEPIPGINTERIEHFFEALGLATAPLITVNNINDVPRTDWGNVFHDDPQLLGHAYAMQRIVVVVNRPELPTSSELIAVHEKAHSTASQTIMIDDNDEIARVRVVRNGFSVRRPIDGHHTHLAKQTGAWAEEALAEICAGTYNALFNAETIQEPVCQAGWRLPLHYTHPEGWRTDRALPAAGLELLIEKDPGILTALLAARTSVAGRRAFAQAVDRLVPGLYYQMLKAPDSDEGFSGVVTRIIDTLYDGDRSALTRVGSRVQAFVAQRLRAYEERTGYSFGLSAEAGGVRRSARRDATGGSDGQPGGTSSQASVRGVLESIHAAMEQLPYADVRLALDGVARTLGAVRAAQAGGPFGAAMQALEQARARARRTLAAFDTGREAMQRYETDITS